jgi:hypothetical protein
MKSETTPDRYALLHEREAQLVRAIEDIKKRAIREAEPLADELMRLRDHRDPKTLIGPNGQVWQYTGPRPDYKLPEEQ